MVAFNPLEAALLAALAIAACAGIHTLGLERSRLDVLLSLVWHLETGMNISTICLTLIFGGLAATVAPATVSLAQSSGKDMSAPKEIGASTPNNAPPNTNTNPAKHRHWRHRGGVHPHYGSRRVRI
jgi:hypothetical protein